MRKKAKTKKLTRSQIVKKLDAVFSTYIRLRDADSKWFVKCPLCWKVEHRKYSQNMHFITRWCYLYRWDETNCIAGCVGCNVILNGNYIIYTRWMQKKYWIAKVDEMIRRKSEICKFKTYELEEMIIKYTLKAEKEARKRALVLN